MEHSPQPPAASEAPSSAAPETPVSHEEPTPTFDKPNLILKDPDPYAFANRIRRLTLVLVILCLVAASPFLVNQFVYQIRRAQMQAEVDVAMVGLEEVQPHLEGLRTASRLVAKRIAPSVVSIRRPGFQFEEEGQGSGVIVDEEGYIVTNLHVVDGAVGLEVELSDGRITDASVIGADPGIDLAVLEIDEPNLIAAEWGDSDDLQVGDLVWAAGSPFGLDRTVTFGIVSAKGRRSASGVTRTAYQEYLQTDVAVNPGNSGGPLVNIKGKIVGINSAIVGRSYRGVSFAIPSSLAKRQYDVLLKKGWIVRGWLGVQPTIVPEPLRRELRLEGGEGVYVSRVVKKGPAHLAGIEAGDVIIKWNGYRAGDPTLLSQEIASTEVGSTASVVIKRIERGRAREFELSVEVGKSPSSIRPEE